MPPENVLEGCVQKQLQGSEQPRTVNAMFFEEQPRIEVRSCGAELSKIEDNGHMEYVCEHANMTATWCSRDVDHSTSCFTNLK